MHWRRRPADAQQLQNGKPIRLIVGLAAGGGTDVTARLIAQQMTQNMGTTVLVENKAGGNFIPAGKEVLASPPDGHTLYFISSSSLITQALYPDYPFDLMKFAPVSEVSTGPLILVAKNGLGVKSMKELIALAKQKPGAIKFGAGGGFGWSLGFGTALLKTLTDINITIVPYRGAGPALNDLLGGHIDAMVDAMPVMSVQAKEGKVTPLAVTGTKRASDLPDVPTMQELGFRTSWSPAGTASWRRPARHRPSSRSCATRRPRRWSRQDVVASSPTQGMEPRGTQPAECAKYMASELAFYKKIIKDANIKPQ